jgi:hypothetical protein
LIYFTLTATDPFLTKNIGFSLKTNIIARRKETSKMVDEVAYARLIEAEKERWFENHPEQRPQSPPRTDMDLIYRATEEKNRTTFKLTNIVSKCWACKTETKGIWWDLINEHKPTCCETPMTGNIHASWECPCGAKGSATWQGITRHTRTKKHQSFVENG